MWLRTGILYTGVVVCIDILLRAPPPDSGMTELPRSDPLAAVSPLDGRYARYTAPLVPYASESALIRARVRVEVEYLVALADLPATPLSLDDATRADLRACYEDFDADDARLVKRLETEGAEGYDA